MKLHKSLLLFCLFAVVGCATTEKYQAILDGWINHDINELIDKWGYPHSSMKLPNGNTVYVYESTDSYISPVQTYVTYHAVGDRVYADTSIVGGDSYTYWCRTFFEVGDDNIIRKWQTKGNSCVSR